RALDSYETAQRTPRDSVKLAIAQCYHSSVEAIFFQERCHEIEGIILQLLAFLEYYTSAGPPYSTH
ncbi:MAG: hypothetical protein KMY54_10420, partial [Erysipelothrix sp.]|nr:hypothetical protein [Erysipelothrix sp.]